MSSHKRELTISPAARRDIKREFKYLEKNGRPGIADRFLTSASATFDILAATPTIAPVHSTLIRNNLEMHRTTMSGAFRHWFVFYSFTDREVRIERIFHDARNLVNIRW